MDIVTSIIGSVAGQIVDPVISFIQRQTGYLLFYNRNIRNLKEELEELDRKKNRVEQFVLEAKNNSKKINSEMVHWQEQVDRVKEEANAFLENETKRNNRCLNGSCPNPKSRYSSGREATKLIESIKAQVDKVGKLGSELAALRSLSLHMASTFNIEAREALPSRQSIQNEVWEALVDDNTRMIGICGMGGVGKTTLVKKIMIRVQSEKSFDFVAMTVISQKPDIERIQNDIAGLLRLKIEDNDTVVVRATKLNQMITSSDKKILLILDDIWKELELGDIGLPSTSKRRGYKIVFTSRIEGVCNKMGSQKNFKIDKLNNDEAWSLFRDNNGIIVDSGKAREVSDECGGLPIAIVTLAKALREKPIAVWNDALARLKDHYQESNPDMQREVYSRLQVSYDLIALEEAKACFLLCCLFPEDYNVSIEDLVRYGMGLRLFQVSTINEARNRVHSLIQDLKDSSMLLEGDYGFESVKMHDVVRGLAIRIASKDEHGYMVRCDAKKKVWTAELERYKAISLGHREIREHLLDVECSKLQLLRVSKDDKYHDDDSKSKPDSFFRRMKELRVVSLEIPSLPQPLDVLKKLRTLLLQNLQYGEISLIGDLTTLEILQLWTNAFSELRELPTEIGKLGNLKLLDLREMLSLKYIPAGVLLRLSKLEELYVTNGFNSWGVDEGGKTNANLSEIESRFMTGLEIKVPNPSVLPKEFDYTNLERFDIFVGERECWPPTNTDGVTKLELHGDASAIRDSGICAVLRKTQVLNLHEVSNLKNVVYFPNMKILSIRDCHELECLVDGTKRIQASQEILQLRDHNASFNNLKEIKIYRCDKLKYVFPSSMAGQMKQLENIEIESCKEIEGIFFRRAEDEQQITARDGEVEYPYKLKTLRLGHLPKLISLCVDLDTGAAGHLLPDPFKVIQRTSIKHTQTKQVLLEEKDLSGHNDEVIFSFMEFNNANGVFNALEELDLHCLSSLVYVWFKISPEITAFQNLRVLRIRNCDNLVNVFSPHMDEDTTEQEGRTKIVFQQLRTLELKTLPNLKSFCIEVKIEFPLLEELEIYECNQMKSFCCEGSVITPMLKKIKMNGFVYPLLEGLNNVDVKEMMLTNLVIEGMSQLPPRSDPSKVRALKVFRCWKDTFPYNFIESFQNLERLIIEYCTVEIFKYERGNVLGFLKLTELKVDRCGCLRNIFSSSVAKALVQLQVLQIKYCGELKEIVTEEEDEAEQEGSIVFPQLRSLYLFGLEKLKSFYNGTCSLEFPLLQDLSITFCHQMETFSYGSLITSNKLQKVRIDDHDYQFGSTEGSDLNAIMRHHLDEVRDDYFSELPDF